MVHRIGQKHHKTTIGRSNDFIHYIGSAMPTVANVAGGVGSALLFAGPEAAPVGVGLIGLGGAIQATTQLMEGKTANSAIKNVNTNLKQGTDGARMIQKTGVSAY